MGKCTCVRLAGVLWLLLLAGMASAAAEETQRPRPDVVELTVPGAALTYAGGSSSPERADAAAHFECARVRVEGDFSEEPGFIVDTGLVMTSAGIVRGLTRPVVRFADGTRRATVVLAVDPRADIAILRFDPTGLSDLLALRLALLPPVMDWSALSPSGNTAPVAQRQDIAGYRPMLRVEWALTAARARVASRPQIESPQAQNLPVVSRIPVPEPALHAASQTKRKPLEIAAPMNLDAFVLTPFAMASEMGRPVNCGEIRAHILGGGGAFSYMGRMGLCPMDPVVTLEVVPVTRETSRSKWANAIVEVLTFPLAWNDAHAHELNTRPFPPDQVVPPYTRPGNLPSYEDVMANTLGYSKEREFRDSFLDLQLVRGGKVVEPVRRIRFPVGSYSAADREASRNYAFGGAYVFDPSVFEPGEALVVRIRKASDPSRWHEKKMNPRVQQAVWDDFTAWRAASG